MIGRTLVWAGLALGGGGCCSTLNPNMNVPAARVSAQPTAVQGLSATRWGPGLPEPQAPVCNEKDELEKALGITAAPACGDLRALPARAIGDGDAPTGKSYPPYCYSAGKIILVVEYEKVGACMHVVGLSAVAKR